MDACTPGERVVLFCFRLKRGLVIRALPASGTSTPAMTVGYVLSEKASSCIRSCFLCSCTNENYNTMHISTASRWETSIDGIELEISRLVSAEQQLAKSRTILYGAGGGRVTALIRSVQLNGQANSQWSSRSVQPLRISLLQCLCADASDSNSNCTVAFFLLLVLVLCLLGRCYVFVTWWELSMQRRFIDKLIYTYCRLCVYDVFRFLGLILKLLDILWDDWLLVRIGVCLYQASNLNRQTYLSLTGEHVIHITR